MVSGALLPSRRIHQARLIILAIMYLFWYTIRMPDIKNQGTFYKTPAGNEPVRDWLKELPQEERKTVGEDIKAVEIAWPVGIPLVKKLDTDLWEVRTILPNKISRVFFTVWQGFMVLLHGIIKKKLKDTERGSRSGKETAQRGFERRY